MKKLKVQLKTKLFLAKVPISTLNAGAQQEVLGGATVSACATGPCPTLVLQTCINPCFSVEGTPSWCVLCS